MARYHKGLEYHDDEIVKHSITKEEIKFLQELQKEMNTQDDVVQADPRYWVIKGSEKLYHVDDGDEYELYDSDCCETIASNKHEIYDYIKDVLLDEMNNNRSDEEKYIISIKDEIFDTSIIIEWSQDGEEERIELCDMNDINNWFAEHGYEYSVIPYKIIPKIYENTMFLTQIDAENHLRANDYHYSEDAHTYAMTAWRSPLVDKLFKILQTVDFTALNSEFIEKGLNNV